MRLLRLYRDTSYIIVLSSLYIPNMASIAWKLTYLDINLRK